MNDSEVDPEVTERALQNFTPIVFALSSATPENVNTEKIIEGLKRDESFQDSIYTIDARAFVRDFISAKPQNGKSKGAADSKKNHTVVEAPKSPAAFLREEYVKIALGRELDRMAAAKAKQDLLESLQAQYLEDGMTEEEALKAAEEDMKEDEEDEGDQEASTVPQRSALYLCVIGFPNTIEDVLEAAEAKVPLDCLLNIVSKVPLAGSNAVESTEKPNEKSRGKGADPAKSGSKRGKVAEDDVSKFLIEQLSQRNAERTMEAYNAADEVLVYTYEFPCDEFPPRVPDGPPVYRLVGSEKAGLLAISEALIQIEESLHLFREWKANRTVVHVAKYAGLLDPDAPKPAPVELVEEKNKRKRSISTSSKKGAPPPPEPLPLLPVLTTEDPHTMEEVAANQETYGDAMLNHRLHKDSFSISAFINSCISQVSASTTTLLEKSARAEKAMLKNKEAVGRFTDYIFHEIMGMIAPSSGKVGALQEIAKVEQKEQNLTVVAGAQEKGSNSLQTNDEVGSPTSNSPQPEPEVILSEEEREKLMGNPKGGILGAEGVHISEDIDAASLSDIITTAITTLYPHISVEQVEEQVKNSLFLAYTGLNVSHKTSSFSRFWFYKNMHAWRPFSKKWGDCFVDVVTKGDGTARTQQMIYSFEGPTTFPEFVAEQKFCEAEKEYFYPPPAESDDEEPEEEEEEEDEEDEDGNIIPRKKKEPEPFPFLDHVSLIQRSMRRRRINEDIIRHIAKPSKQETIHHGVGSRCASEEVEWLFPADGALIEVERTVVNTKQLSCVVSPPRGLEFGFLYSEPNASCETVEEYVPSHIRCFVGNGRTIQVFTEVVADNTVVAEKKMYEKAVEEAKLEAKKQLEALQIAKKSARGKDKAAVLPTLAELEQACINAIPRPQAREKCPPTLQITALLNNGTTFVSFNELEETLHVKTFSWATLTVDLPIRIWRNNRMDTLVLFCISSVYVHADGSVEIFSPQSQGYRILLHNSGTYMSEKDGQCLVVSKDGRCSLRTSQAVTMLPPLKSSQMIDLSTKDEVTDREDGVQWITHGQDLRRVRFGRNVTVSHDGDECTWMIFGVPSIKYNHKTRTFGMEVDKNMLSFDLTNSAVVLTCRDEKYRALFDLIEYRLHVHPIDSSSMYTVDCAFGGLYGEVVSPSGPSIFRVSPFGRCSEEKGGLLVFPRGYVTPENQPLMRLHEIWSPSFVDTLADTDVLVERDALHLLESVDRDPVPSIPERRVLTNKAIESFYETRGAKTLKQITDGQSSERRVLNCTCVSNADRSITLVFMEPSSAHVLTTSFLRNFNALHSCAFGVDKRLPGLEEYVLAVNSPCVSTSGKSKSAKVLLPSTVDDLFLTTSENLEEPIAWYWLVRSLQAEPLDDTFFSTFFDHQRLQRGYEDALDFLCKNLPLAQKEEFLRASPRSIANCEPQKAVISGTADGSANNRTEEKDLECVPMVCPKRSMKQNVAGSDAENNSDNSNWGKSGRLNYWKTFNGTLPKEVPMQVHKSKPKAVHNSQKSADSAKPSNAAAEPSTAYLNSPLMATKSYRAVADTGKTAASRGHFPMLSFAPDELYFGSIKTNRRYAAMVYLTNTSTVPCRYRVIVPKDFKPFCSVQYPRHFLAPGLTEGVEVRISGTQALGEMEMPLLLAHEGGSHTVMVRWKTVNVEPEVCLSPAALCISETPEAFVPGTTTRFKRRNSEDLIFEEDMEDDSSDDDGNEPPF